MGLVGGLVNSLLTYKIFKPKQKNGINLNHKAFGDEPYPYEKPARTWKQKLAFPFSLINEGLKWISRQVVLDNFVSKYLIGTIIAAVANFGNGHYKTKAKTITQTLGPLIFQAGLSDGQVTKDGDINLDPTLGKQYKDIHTFGKKFEIEDNQYTYKADPSIVFKKSHIQLNKKTVLAGIEGHNDLVNEENKNDHLHMIHFNGNSGTYHEDSHFVAQNLCEFAKKDKAVTAIQFNYPGVVNSTGHVDKAADLVEAGIAQVQRLLDRGVPADKIALTGSSLGGSISSHVASFYYSKGIELNGLYVSNTFSSTTNVGLSYVRRVPVVGPFFGFVLRPLLTFGLWGSRWQLDTAAHYTKLPEKMRNYSFVRSPKHIRKEYRPTDDPVIDHFASLHTSWRLRAKRGIHKRGLAGYKKENYRKTRRSHKMYVFEKKADGAFVFAPKKCGHSETLFNHGEPGITWRHRGGTDDSMQIEGEFPGDDNGIAEGKIKLGYESGAKIRSFFATPKAEREGNDSWKESAFRSGLRLVP